MRTLRNLLLIGGCLVACHRPKAPMVSPTTPVSESLPPSSSSVDSNTTAHDKLSLTEVEDRLSQLAPDNVEDNKIYFRTLCENLDLFPHAKAPFNLIKKVVLHNADLSALMAEIDCGYIADVLFEQEARTDILKLDLSPVAADGSRNPLSEELAALDEASDFRLLKHMKSFFKGVSIYGTQGGSDRLDDDIFIPALLETGGAFCNFDILSAEIRRAVKLQVDDSAGCIPAINFRLVTFSGDAKMTIVTSRSSLSLRLQLNGLTSLSDLSTRLDVPPGLRLNLFSYSPDLGPKLFIGDNLNPYLWQSWTGFEAFSAIDQQVFKATDKPYLNFADTALSDIDAITASLAAEFNSYMANNLAVIAKTSMDTKKDCASLMRFRAVSLQPGWYTQQVYDALSPSQKDRFQSLTTHYANACASLKQTAGAFLDASDLFQQVCAAQGIKSTDLKAVFCDFSGVTL